MPMSSLAMRMRRRDQVAPGSTPPSTMRAEPVERGIRVAAAYGFVQGAEIVVVETASPPLSKRRTRCAQGMASSAIASVISPRCRRRGSVARLSAGSVSRTRVAVRAVAHSVDKASGVARSARERPRPRSSSPPAHVASSSFEVPSASSELAADSTVARGTAAQRIDLERRVLGGRPDEGDQACRPRHTAGRRPAATC